MSSQQTITVQTLKRYAGLSVLLGALPACVFAAFRWLLYADLFALGMYRSAFFYLRAALNDLSTLWLFAGILAGVCVIHAVLTRWLRDAARVARGIDGVFILIVIGLLLLTGARLNHTDWFPDPPSIRFVYCNAAVVLVYAVAAWFVHAGRPRLQASLGWCLVAGALLVVNGAYQYFRATMPVMFTDVAEEVGLRETDNTLGIGWGDFNNDGWLDLYVSDHLPIVAHSYLYQNEHGRFAAPRIMASGDRHGVAWGDYDNDGWSDLFVAGGNNTPIGPPFANILFHNVRGRLADVAATAGVADTPGRAYGGGWADINNDGLIDLLAVNYFTPNALFVNTGGGSFRDVTQSAGIASTAPGTASPDGTVCASWADYDDDGFMDLVTVGLHRGIALFHNQRDGTFVDVAAQSGLVIPGFLGTESDPRGPTGCAWGDYDNDGRQDLFVAAHSQRNLLFRNLGNGHFAEVGAAAGVAAAANSQAAVWGDFNNDGYLDLYVVNVAPDTRTDNAAEAHGWNTLYLNRGDGTFREVPADRAGVAGYPYVRETTATVADYDNDGYLDILIANERPYPDHMLERLYLRRNILLHNTGTGGHWLEIRLRGTVSNRDGIGARLALVAGGLRQFRQRGSESHTYGQSSPVVHFGLGRARTIDRLTVTWPSGIVQTLTAVAPDQLLTLTEPARR